MAQKDKIAMIETLNNGKPIRETTAIDIPFAARHFHYFASVIETEEGTVNDIDKDTMSIVRNMADWRRRCCCCLELPNAISCMVDCASHCCR